MPNNKDNLDPFIYNISTSWYILIIFIGIMIDIKASSQLIVGYSQFCTL